jgi:hypothetical protein
MILFKIKPILFLTFIDIFVNNFHFFLSKKKRFRFFWQIDTMFEFNRYFLPDNAFRVL